MAFNKLGYYTLASGQSMTIRYWWGGPGNEAGDDRGAQYCMADPEANPGILWVTRQGKERVNFPTGRTVGTIDLGYIFHRYWVTVQHQVVIPGRSTDFTLQGGGLV
jgi:hypothetical protein